MKLYLKQIVVKRLLILKTHVNRIFYYAILKIKNVDFDETPSILGPLFIRNAGNCHLKSGITFRSSLTDNFVGIYKPCSVYVGKGASLSIGANTGFSGVSIYCAKNIQIGNWVNVGGNVSIWDTDFHPLQYDSRRVHDITKIRTSSIVIEDDVFIGANSIVLKGVVIGKRSVVGAGSVVTKSIPAGEVWAGNPARFIRKL